MDVFFNRQSAFLCVQTVILFSLTCSFIRTRQISYEKKLDPFLNSTFRSIDDVLSLHNSRLGDFVDRMDPIELEIKDTIDIYRYVAHLDIQLEIDSERQLRAKLYDTKIISMFPL